MAEMVKNLSAVWETWVWSLGQADPLEKGMQPTPVFLPGESHGQRSLAGYSPWDHKELDTTEWLTHTQARLSSSWLSYVFHPFKADLMSETFLVSFLYINKYSTGSIILQKIGNLMSASFIWGNISCNQCRVFLIWWKDWKQLYLRMAGEQGRTFPGRPGWNVPGQ